MDQVIEKLINSLPIWNDKITIKVIDGGITNKNFLVQDSKKKYFVRLGDNIPEHNISRSNEEIALIHPLDNDYFFGCRSKLGWGKSILD